VLVLAGWAKFADADNQSVGKTCLQHSTHDIDPCRFLAQSNDNHEKPASYLERGLPIPVVLYRQATLI
jgi:hypothetical protein